MADYLGNLARRTAAAPAIRPRARSIFEPVRGAGSPAFEIENHVTIERHETIAAPHPTAPHPAAPHAATPPPAPVLQSPQRSVQPPARIEPPALREPSVATPPKPAPPAAQNAQRTTSQDHPEPAIALERPIGKHVEPVHPERPVQAPPAAVNTESPKPVSSAPAAPVAAPVSKPAANTGLSERLIEKTPRVDHVVRPAMTERRSREHAPQPRAAAELARVHEPAATAPDIHISIGRVIVQAAAPAPTKPAPEARTYAPRVPLEQYLQQRGGRS